MLLVWEYRHLIWHLVVLGGLGSCFEVIIFGIVF
jgi:predicted membrane channel-forming protein YqfA (hemolysin III family)